MVVWMKSFVSSIWRTSVFVILLFVLWTSPSVAEVLFFGRSYGQIKQQYCFEDEDLKDKAILDVAAGPSTFLGTLKDNGWLGEGSLALDLKYIDLNTVREVTDAGLRGAFFFYYDRSYLNLPEERKNRFLQLHSHFQKVNDDFLRLYEKYGTALYVQGDVRKLDQVLPQNSDFDLILSSNLLFLYSEREKELDLNFHLEAIQAMVPFLKQNGEIRLFPLDTLSGKSPEFLSELIQTLEMQNLVVKITEGCGPSTSQAMRGAYDARGAMMIIKKTM